MKKILVLLFVLLGLPSIASAVECPSPLNFKFITADYAVPLAELNGCWVLEVTQPDITITLPAVGAGRSVIIIMTGNRTVHIKVDGAGFVDGVSEFALARNNAARFVSGSGTCNGGGGFACWYAH